MSIKSKRYGSDSTALTLTEKALAVYSSSDITIYEEPDCTYTLCGIDARDGLSADEVNEVLEDLYDEQAGDPETFVRELFDGGNEPMTIETARSDLDRFSREGWIFPEMTPEEYTEIYNNLLREYQQQ